MKYTLIAATLMLIFSANAHAIKCYGKVTHLYVESDGDFYINGDWRDNSTQICNIQTPWKTVDSEVCRGWMTLLLTSKVTDRELTMRYADADVVSCETIPTYSAAPAPVYVMHK